MTLDWLRVCCFHYRFFFDRQCKPYECKCLLTNTHICIKTCCVNLRLVIAALYSEGNVTAVRYDSYPGIVMYELVILVHLVTWEKDSLTLWRIRTYI